LKTVIIAHHEEFKVVEDLHKDVQNQRDRETGNNQGEYKLKTYKDGTLLKQKAEEEEKNRKFEVMLNQDNEDI